jgi:hypothetical protein
METNAITKTSVGTNMNQEFICAQEEYKVHMVWQAIVLLPWIVEINVRLIVSVNHRKVPVLSMVSQS